MSDRLTITPSSACLMMPGWAESDLHTGRARPMPQPSSRSQKVLVDNLILTRDEAQSGPALQFGDWRPPRHSKTIFTKSQPSKFGARDGLWRSNRAGPGILASA